MKKRYIDYEHFYNCRIEEKDCKKDHYPNYDVIFLNGQFPKTIKKGTMILSEQPYVAYDLMKETMALFELNKPLQVNATSGHWYGTPFFLSTTDDFEITLDDEIFIQNYQLIGKKNID
jgi:hypothetical protein